MDSGKVWMMGSPEAGLPQATLRYYGFVERKLIHPLCLDDTVTVAEACAALVCRQRDWSRVVLPTRAIPCCFQAFHHPTLSSVHIYAGLLLKMSESPASRIAMVEHLKSLPQAVPSSICVTDTVS